MEWLEQEGRIRDIANDQRLFRFTIVRLKEKRNLKMKKQTVHLLHSICLSPEKQVFFAVFENLECSLFDFKNYESVYEF